MTETSLRVPNRAHPSKGHWKLQGQRTKILKLARCLARSGQHQSHGSIVAEFELLEGFADAHRCLTDRVISAQLDRLCAMAQASAQAGALSLAAFLAETRQAARQ
jgi:hypothetical protein